jgi:hypothetical protein
MSWHSAALIPPRLRLMSILTIENEVIENLILGFEFAGVCLNPPMLGFGFLDALSASASAGPGMHPPRPAVNGQWRNPSQMINGPDS